MGGLCKSIGVMTMVVIECVALSIAVGVPFTSALTVSCSALAIIVWLQDVSCVTVVSTTSAARPGVSHARWDPIHATDSHLDLRPIANQYTPFNIRGQNSGEGTPTEKESSSARGGMYTESGNYRSAYLPPPC